MEISVVICSHNPRRDYLRRTLDALQAQTLPVEGWELVLVDNASKEPVADAWDLSWHPSARHVREDEVGLTHARLRGIREAKGDLLVFVDDDNVLEPGFLAEALAIQGSHPFLGVFGAGSLEPEFEIEPPPELVSRLPLLALRKERSAIWGNDFSHVPCIPWGAGLCVTRLIADRYVELIGKLRATVVLGRRGSELFSGEDDVFSWASVWAGRGFGVFPELRLTHLISAGRLNQRYFLRLSQAHAYSHGVLNYLLNGTVPRRIGPVRYVHLLLHGLKNGVFSMRCEWARSRGGVGAAGFIADSGREPVGEELKRVTAASLKCA